MKDKHIGMDTFLLHHVIKKENLTTTFKIYGRFLDFLNHEHPNTHAQTRKKAGLCFKQSNAVKPSSYITTLL